MFELEKFAKDLDLKSENITPEFLRDYCSYMFSVSTDLLSVLDNRYTDLIKGENDQINQKSNLSKFLILNPVTKGIEELNYMRKMFSDKFEEAVAKIQSEVLPTATTEADTATTAEEVPVEEVTPGVGPYDSSPSNSCK